MAAMIKKSFLAWDYQWLMECPDLVRGCYQVTWRPLNAAGADDLVSFIPAHARPLLGQYFENLLAFALTGDRQISDLVRNVQVSDGRNTIGEFDFLFRRHDLACHLEVAIKFYLGSGDLSRAENWFGPNCHDRLSLKLDKMFQKQLKLSQTSAGKDCLAQLGYGEVVPCHLVKGMLFYPYDRWSRAAFSWPDVIAPAHLKGWWCPLDRAQEILHTAEYWTILKKPHWLSTGQSAREVDILTPDELFRRLEKHFCLTKSPLLVAALLPEDCQGETWGQSYREVHRGFITPVVWPFRGA